MKTIRQFLRSNRGFTIFFATLITSLALAIGLAIYDLTVRELDLSATANQSQYAIYAADTGAECGLYWDSQYTDADKSAFATSSSDTSSALGKAAITCAGVTINAAGNWAFLPGADGESGTTTFTLSLTAAANSPCLKVEVGKQGDPSKTTIISHGYNTCQAGVTKLERALQVSY